MKTSIKRLSLFLLTLVLLLSVSFTAHAEAAKPKKTTDTSKVANSDAAKKAEEAKKAETEKKAEEDKKIKDLAEKKADAVKKAEDAKNEGNRVMPNISEQTIVAVSILFFAIMAFLFYSFFEYIRKNRQRIGFQSIKLIGLVLIFPGICIVALVGNGLIGGNTLAALFGTIAGYVLSKEDDPKKTPADKTLDELKDENTNLTKDIDDLKKEITKLKAQLPKQS